MTRSEIESARPIAGPKKRRMMTRVEVLKKMREARSDAGFLELLAVHAMANASIGRQEREELQRDARELRRIARIYAEVAGVAV